MLHLCLIVENGKGGYMRTLKIDSAIFYFKKGQEGYKKSRFNNFIYKERKAGQGDTMFLKDFKTACSDVPSKLCCLHCLRADVTVLDEV